MTSEVAVPEAAIEAAFHAAIVAAVREGTVDRKMIRAALTAALPHLSTAIRDAVLEEAAKVAEAVGNFGNYRRDELTDEFGKPRFDMMREIMASIRALKGKSIPAPTNAALETVAVPKVALDWLMGAGPDPAGLWFGDFPEDYPQPPGAFWWRTTFKEICAYASSNARKSIPAPAEGNEAEAADSPSDKLGKWLSAALGDPNVCVEMKADINAWFKAGQPAAPAQAPGELAAELTRPIIGIENRSAQEAFNIMADRIRHAIATLSQGQRGAVEAWQPISTAPKDKHVILWVKGWKADVAREGWWGHERYNRSTKQYEKGWVVHASGGHVEALAWQPLPAIAAAPVHQEAGE